MNQAVKEKWLEALRSGEYEQGEQCLKSGDKYCCLGVLCDIYLKENNKSWSSDDEEGMPGGLGFPPFEIQLWAGLHSSSPYLCSIQADCHSANDSLKLSFNEIADAIEKDL